MRDGTSKERTKGSEMRELIVSHHFSALWSRKASARFTREMTRSERYVSEERYDVRGGRKVKDGDGSERKERRNRPPYSRHASLTLISLTAGG
eukprot:s425_g9.t1